MPILVKATQRPNVAMAEAPATRITLLNRIRDIADSEAWAEFATLYGPVVYGFARKRGLQDADASDLVQDVLRSVARNAEKLEYDPKRGTFRGWLYTVARNKIFNFLNSQRNRARGVGDDGSDHDRLDSLADKREDQEAIWETGVPAQAQQLGDGRRKARIPARHVEGLLGHGGGREDGCGHRTRVRYDDRRGIRSEEPLFWLGCVTK